MRNQKNQFIRRYADINCSNIRAVALKGALKAATMHNRTYIEGVTNIQRNVFKNAWREEIETLGEKYLANDQSIETFIQDVLTMKRHLSEQYYDILFNGGIRIGQCQKAFAIYLKWCWCYSNTMPAPPMCAIDSHVLKCAGIEGCYTRLDDEVIYRGWVNEIIRYAAIMCIHPINGVVCHNVAEWELVTFNRIVINH